MPDAISIVYRCEKKGDLDGHSDMFSKEDDVLWLINDLKKHYDELRIGFRTSVNGNQIDTARDFLKTVLQQHYNHIITLEGTGKIAGISIHEGRVEYDLSEAYKRVECWDYCIKGSERTQSNLCTSLCLKETGIAQDREMVPHCAAGKEMGNPLACPDFAPKVKNSQGKLARPLDVLIEEVLK